MASSDRFGYEWDTYHFLDPHYEQQFRGWVCPLVEKDFRDKTVLDAGCGMGRNSYWALRWGAKKLVAFDFDQRTTMRAKETLKKFSNAEVIFKSIYDIDFNQEFDIVFCIGVLHHLEKPREAIRKLFQAVRPGGKLVFWVYSREGNEWIVRYVDPIRKMITSRLPVSLVYYLSYLCSAPLCLWVRLFRGPSPYLRQLASFDFWHVHSIVFDQLIPKVAHYWSYEDLQNLFFGFNKEIILPKNNCGWTVRINKDSHE